MSGFTSLNTEKSSLTSKGELRRITKLSYWSLQDVLIEKYYMEETEAAEFSDFLMTMLKWMPSDR